MLEPVLEWSSFQPGQTFAPVHLKLSGELIDSYLQATGESHPLYAGGEGFVPLCLLTMVRYSKASIAGRWPSGTVQLEQRVRALRALRRHESIRMECELATKEVRNERPYFELTTQLFDASNVTVGDMGGRSLWGGPATERTAERATGRAAEPGPERATRLTTTVKSANANLAAPDWHRAAAHLKDEFPMTRLMAFGDVAGARDPIHLDPVFARSTRFGRNIAQGRLVMTLLSRLMLQLHGRAWLDSGWFQIRFDRPVSVDDQIEAFAIPESSRAQTYRLACRNESGEIVIDGHGGV